jgi:tRNA dimethylallyltransferase
MQPKRQDGTVSSIKQLAIIGATASGKSGLAIKLAKKHDAIIFSIDSLAVYKEMDIVSAKPTREEQSGVLHLGIDILGVPEHFSAATVAKLYKEARAITLKNNQLLIIVGGSSFYLKSLMTGLSELPEFSASVQSQAKEMLQNPSEVRAHIHARDPQSVANIDPNDRYRLEKLLLILLQTGQNPTDYYEAHPAKPVIETLDIFEIKSDREVLRKRIALRTQMMLDAGLIDEIAALEAKYGRSPASMKAIGVIETLEYLDGYLSQDELTERITIHTAQLAKRQTTFNKTQFEGVVRGSVEELFELIDSYLVK